MEISQYYKGDCMNTFGDWFRRFCQRLKSGFRHFMTGRYGGDKLNMLLLGIGAASCILALFLRPIYPLLTAISYIMMFWALFRALSRNTYKRYQENRKYLMLKERLKDREHRYFDCPRCRQPVRVPRGKGKISITCPKCKEKFIRKT